MVDRDDDRVENARDIPISRVKCPAIDIEFIDLSYTVPHGKNDTKAVLRNVGGLFKSRQLTAILGASGAGKSTLLNLLAGYKTGHSNGHILINGKPRELNNFRKISRYIMQEDLLQPKITALEAMRIAAHLKLGRAVSSKQKKATIEEIMDKLRLTNVKNTETAFLSGGEKKRLSIALELLNNPPILFLDEPTTGLDDQSSIQCIQLLKMLSQDGRTIICSIHTPSARLFALFDHVYILNGGQCVFAGIGDDIVPYLSTIGLHCPTTYNPADFMIEVSSGEYGDYTDKMVVSMDNGRCHRWNKPLSSYVQPNEKVVSNESEKEDLVMHMYEFKSSAWFQFNILLYRMFLQLWRDKSYLLLKCLMYIFIGCTIGGMYFKMGEDASKTLFNFGFCFVTNIVFLYLPLLPVLLNFPLEVKLLKREYFNKWYGLNAYFFAHFLSRMPLQLLLCFFYIPITYFMTGQPLEWSRGIKFSLVCMFVAIISESMGYAISAQLNIVNSVFLGPALSVPFMLLAVYGIGTGSEHIPIIIRIAMGFSYIRYGLEGLVLAVYGNERKMMTCPEDTIFCQLKYPDELLLHVGMEDANYWIDIIALTVILISLKILCYILLRMRLSTAPSRLALTFIGRFVKSHFTLAR